MNDKTPATPSKSDAPIVRHGVLPGLVHLALDVADKSQATAFSVIGDARTELRTAVDHGIDLAEKLTAAALRFTRKVVQRVDDASGETLASAERVLGGAVKSARDTTHAAVRLATTAAAGVAASA